MTPPFRQGGLPVYANAVVTAVWSERGLDDIAGLLFAPGFGLGGEAPSRART